MSKFRISLLIASAVLSCNTLLAQDDFSYQKPPKAIIDMVQAKPTPAVSIDRSGEWMLFTERNSYPSVAELAQPELKIAGLRINPANFSPSRQAYINTLYLRNIKSGKEVTFKGLPPQLSAGNITWSPDGKKIALSHTHNSGSDIYIINIVTATATKVNKSNVNLISNGIQWLDNNSVLYFAALKPATAAPKATLLPKGPAVQESYGSASPRPTYQDMIKTPHDEDLFEFFATTQLIKNTNGTEAKIGQPGIYQSISLSPDKKFILSRTTQKPFSYLVPFSGFSSTVTITDASGKLVKKLATLPSNETAPSGRDNIQNIPRSFSWRDDQPSTITWALPLDSGKITKDVPYRDAVYALSAPFSGKEEILFKTKMRYRGTTWGNDGLALVNDGLTGKQVSQISRFSSITGDLELLFSRSTTDAYSNPGSAVTTTNDYGRQVLLMVDNGNKIFFNNTTGSSPKGDIPFLLSFDVHKKTADTLWKSPETHFESIVRILDANNLSFITRKESATEMPNYWLKNLKLRIADVQLTKFSTPYPQLENVVKEKLKYKRADGVDLTGELYLPAGYDAKRDGPLPVVIWAYPREYNSASDAAQIRGSEQKFTLINYGSPIFYVTQGYAVLNNAEMPIVAKDSSTKPNDDFIQQLKLNAEAAVNFLAEKGVGDRNRVAVGGHSYGAFMTAHLLAHTNLFKAGIARSGAYNRTLTPYGFQNEDRTYWQAPQLYYDMSPFSYADKIKTPILLVHGDADNNTGTYPIQSERMFNAIKGQGGNVRYVSLPYESHGYSGMENILHLLYEQFTWLEKYVKNAK